MYTTNIYVITYNNYQRLNENVMGFFETTAHLKGQFSFRYHIINNHPNFELAEHVQDVMVFHNFFRPIRSCGHLSRDYNAALIHGFGDLTAPDCDQVICCHDDISWNRNWFETLLDIHAQYTFYAGDHGCSMTSYLPDAIKKIGLWDERFVGLGYHEADYYLRALIYNKEKSTINDGFGGRILNPTSVVFTQPPTNKDKQNHMNAAIDYHTISRKVFAEKWGVHPEHWKARLKTVPAAPLILGYLYYPWFELDVETLDAQRYVYQPKGLEHFLDDWK